MLVQLKLLLGQKSRPEQLLSCRSYRQLQRKMELRTRPECKRQHSQMMRQRKPERKMELRRKLHLIRLNRLPQSCNQSLLVAQVWQLGPFRRAKPGCLGSGGPCLLR